MWKVWVAVTLTALMCKIAEAGSYLVVVGWVAGLLSGLLITVYAYETRK
jgi:hypothetical protein